MVVTSLPEDQTAFQNFFNPLENIEIVGVAYNARAALRQLQDVQADVLLIDVMLPGFRSIDVISNVAATQPVVKILALSPGDPPHDRIILALQAGALGYVCWDEAPAEVTAAIHTVCQGEYYLPLNTTYEVLQAAASELLVFEKEKRGQLVQAILGLIPITGLIAAMTGFLWREYWGQIGVRVVDLGVDASTRVTEFMLTFFVIFGILGPMLFVESWVDMMRSWANRQSDLKSSLTKVRRIRLGPFAIGRFLSRPRVQQFGLALLILAITIPLDITGGRMLTILIGTIVVLVVLANVLGLENQLPDALKLPKHAVANALILDGVLFLILMIVLSAEVFLVGPNLFPDGLHGFLAPKVLDLSAKPVMIYDLNEKYEPLGALYLGGNADLYVLYDPCKKTVRMIPVGSSRVEYIPEVQCPKLPQ
jgi:CheY-like chemotaxis protein